jgi:short-subunit dehydrogenase
VSRSLADLFPTAFVTGASSGLGREFVQQLLAEGVQVWGTTRDAGRVADLAAKYPTSFTPVALDLHERGAALAAFQRAAKSVGGSFHLLINNAGYGVFGAFEETDCKIWLAQIEAMLGTSLALTHEALRSMRTKNRGTLVNVSSIAVEYPLPFMAGYNVAKAGLSGLSESLFIETRGTGIKVIDFRPGDFRTDFNQAMLTSAASPAATTVAPKAWQILEANLQAAPKPEKAARDLMRALRRGRSATVRSGAFFQVVVAPLFGRVVPASIRRAFAARYFGI